MGVAEGIVVVQNPCAGPESAEEQARRIARLFGSEEPRARILMARTETEIVEAARLGIAGDAAVVVAAGGDGTVSTVAAVLAGTKVPLGVLPAGTLNHFAKDLQVPMKLEEAARTVRNGRIEEIDLSEVNGRVFINNSSLGLYPSIVREREHQQRMGYGKWPAFAWAAWLALRRYPFLNLRMEVDGRELIRSTPFVFIGNNIYQMEGLDIGSRASLMDGQMCLYVLRRTGRAGLLFLSLTAPLGRLRYAKNFDAFCAREVWIETGRRRVVVAIDGEVYTMESPLHYRVRPRALRVIVP